MYVLTKEEGGRHTPFFSGYRPQFYFRTTDVTGTIKLPDGVEMVMPGDNIRMEITLITPIAMDEGLRFAIREGGRTVASGVVSGFGLPKPFLCVEKVAAATFSSISRLIVSRSAPEAFFRYKIKHEPRFFAFC